MDRHRLPDNQPIFDQFPDLLTWETTMHLVSQVGPSPKYTHHNPESKQDMPETLLTSLVFKNGGNWRTSISFLKNKTQQQQQKTSSLLDVLQHTQNIHIWGYVIKIGYKYGLVLQILFHLLATSLK